MEAAQGRSGDEVLGENRPRLRTFSEQKSYLNRLSLMVAAHKRS